VAEILAEVGRPRVLRIGVPDWFNSRAGGHQYLRGQAGVTPTAVVAQVLTALG
jgi:transketolase C-terminal domain/subunit